MISRCGYGIAAVLALLLAAPGQAATIASEDFELGATGWNDNTTTIGGAVLGNQQFLGRFGGSGGTQAVFKTFLLSGLQTQVTVSFDFFKIDTWDNEFFSIFIDDVQIQSDPFGLTANAAPANSVLVSPFADYGFGGLPFGEDEVFRYTFLIPTAATSIKVGFGSTLDDFIDDESYGIDNVLVTDNAAVPEPSSVLLFGTALLAGWVYRRRKA